MSHSNLVIRGRRVILPDLNSFVGSIAEGGERPSGFSTRPASVHIRDGIIADISSYDVVPSGYTVVDTDEESVVMPGLVDTHVHINEPGRAEWEGFWSATRAAAAGGVTTLIDMPLNCIPPTTTLDGLEAKIEAARNRCHVDVGFWGGVVPGNTRDLAPLFAAGVVGFKCFLVDSGVEEFPNVTETHLLEAMPELARLGALLIVHAELTGPIDDAAGRSSMAQATNDLFGSITAYKTFLASRPRAAENEAIELMIHLSAEFGTRVHIVHHSSADALSALRKARLSGVNITAETCPHYLYFVAEEIPDEATQFKCCPPIRERENRELLWQALAEGTIEMVVSDHSPCPPEMKLRERGDFMKAWGGISSLQLRLPAVWTEAKRRGHTIEELSAWLCDAPAKLVGFDGRKGSIAVGNDADIVIWKPDQQFLVEPRTIHHRHKLTPYEGEVLDGTVQATFLRGEKVYDGGEFLSNPTGMILMR